MKEIVNIVPTDKPFVDGGEYYHLVNGEVRLSTVYKCETCDKLCTVNSVLITSFGQREITIKVLPNVSEEELCYSEETELNTCEACYAKGPQ